MLYINIFNSQMPENWLTNLIHWNRKFQQTDSVTRTFKQATVAQKALELQYSTYYCYTHRKFQFWWC